MKKTLLLMALTATALSATAEEQVLYMDGIVRGDQSTYYNFTKSYGAADDSDMCWAIASACAIAWWQDRVEQSGALIMPNDVPRGEAVWTTMRSFFKNKGGQPGRAMQFWLSGDTQYSDYSNEMSWYRGDAAREHEARGGFFPRLAGTHQDFSYGAVLPSGCMIASVDSRGYSVEHGYEAASQRVVELIKDGYGGIFSTGAHAMVFYGVYYEDTTNYLTGILYDDNNFSSDNYDMKAATVCRGQNRRKEGETEDHYATYATVSYTNDITNFALMRTKGIQFTDYDVRVGKNFGGEDEFLFSHYCNLVVDGSENYELKYDLRDASREGSPVDPILTTYDRDGKTVLDQKTVSTGNLRLMDGTVTLVDATGDTAAFDKGGSVEGVLSFEDSAVAGAAAARKLSVQRNGATVGELAIKATEGTNTLEVTQGNTATFGKLTGTGGLDKVGMGAAEVTDEVSLVGAIRVHEGAFILGADVALTEKTQLTVLGGGSVQGKAGKDITLSFTSGVHENNGTMTLATTVKNGAVLKGSGTFGDVAVQDGGKLIVGNSPGRQEYLGNLSVNMGEIVFGVSGWDTQADAENVGWGSGAYSNIVMNGGSLTLGGGSQIRFGVGDGALSALLASDSGTAFSMTIATGFGNKDYFSSQLLEQLAEQTIFYVTDEAGAAIANDAGLTAGDTLNTRITDLKYNLVDNTALCVTGVYWAAQPVVPEPATGTLSLLGLCALAARRRKA